LRPNLTGNTTKLTDSDHNRGHRGRDHDLAAARLSVAAGVDAQAAAFVIAHLRLHPMTTPPAKIALRVSQEFSLPTALVLSGRTYAHHRCHGFRGVDLNLLICLRVLLVEQHVTRSAERLGITQPAAMSASLGALADAVPRSDGPRSERPGADATGRTAS
jgi:hypothetical protein